MKTRTSRMQAMNRRIMLAESKAAANRPIDPEIAARVEAAAKAFEARMDAGLPTTRRGH